MRGWILYVVIQSTVLLGVGCTGHTLQRSNRNVCSEATALDVARRAVHRALADEYGADEAEELLADAGSHWTLAAPDVGRCRISWVNFGGSDYQAYVVVRLDTATVTRVLLPTRAGRQRALERAHAFLAENRMNWGEPVIARMNWNEWRLEYPTSASEIALLGQRVLTVPVGEGEVRSLPRR